MSAFFSWLEDEDLILKSPVRRIHKVRTDSLVKETLTDEQLEKLRDACTEIRDLALIDLLASTGMRVGELVRMDRTDINFHERSCIVSKISANLLESKRFILTSSAGLSPRWPSTKE